MKNIAKKLLLSLACISILNLNFCTSLKGMEEKEGEVAVEPAWVCCRKLPIGAWSISSLAWSPCGGVLASIVNDGRVIIFCAGTGRILSSFKFIDIPTDIAWHPGGEMVAMMCFKPEGDKYVVIVDIRSGRELARFKAGNEISGSCSSEMFRWFRDGKRIAVANKGKVRIFDAIAGYRLSKIAVDFGNYDPRSLGPHIGGFSLSPNDRQIAVWTNPGVFNARREFLRIYDVSSGRIVFSFKDPQLKSWLNDLFWISPEKFVCVVDVGVFGGTLLDVSFGQLEGITPNALITGTLWRDARFAKLSPDGSTLVIGLKEEVLLFNMGVGEVVLIKKIRGSHINAEWSSDGKELVLYKGVVSNGVVEILHRCEKDCEYCKKEA